MILNKQKNMHVYSTKKIPFLIFIEILIITFLTKDTNMFLLFIKRCFEQTHFKIHKKILIILFETLKKQEKLLTFYQIKGFFFDIRGKVGVSGNAKKRHLSCSIGKITTTSQNIKSTFNQIEI